MELNVLKKAYGAFAQQYRLPPFRIMNEYFEIEKIEKESDSLLRVVRKVMMEKIVNSLGFVEMLLTSINAPRTYHAYIKTMSSDDRKNLELLYWNLSQLSMDSLALEIETSEKAEADLIKKICTTWGEIRPLFRDIMHHMQQLSGEKQTNVKRERSYFG